MVTKFNNETLDIYCKENNITLIKDYSQIKVTRETIIEGKCLYNGCNNNFEKVFRQMYSVSGAYCKSCTHKIADEKRKNTNKVTYGVDYISQSKEIKDKMKETNLEKYGVEYASQSKGIKDKIKETNLEKYGVEYALQSKEIKDKIKETNLEKYGTEYGFQNEEVKNKIKKTVKEKYGVDNIFQNKETIEKSKQTLKDKYGVEHPAQSDEIKEKMKKTNLKKFGSEHASQNQEIKDKVKNTNIEKFGTTCSLVNPEIRKKSLQTIKEKYGVDNVSKSDEIKQKKMDTCMKNYGVPFSHQNPEIMEKVSKKSYLRKEYISPTGKIFICQGYEPFVLEHLISKDKINEDDIINGEKNVPKIIYQDENGVRHTHYPDIYLKPKNKIIEVKSEWTINKKQDNVFEKQKAAKEQGYLYEIWVTDRKGKILEIHA